MGNKKVSSSVLFKCRRWPLPALFGILWYITERKITAANFVKISSLTFKVGNKNTCSDQCCQLLSFFVHKFRIHTGHFKRRIFNICIHEIFVSKEYKIYFSEFLVWFLIFCIKEEIKPATMFWFGKRASILKRAHYI